MNYLKFKMNNGFKKGHSVSEKIKQWNRDKFTKIFSFEETQKIIKDYSENKIPINRIAHDFNCSNGPITKVLKKNNILIRKKGEHNIGKELSIEHKNKVKIGRLNYENSKHRIDMSKLGDLYLKDKITCGKLAEMFNTNIHTIMSRLDSLGIKRESSSEFLKNKWRDPMFRARRAEASIKGQLIRPTSFEKRISDLCIKNNLPFVYTGDGRFLINYKNPDFIDQTNKIAIEVFHSYYKIRDYGSVENYIKFCKSKYESAGWKVIFIDENEVHFAKNWEEICLNKIRKFA